MLASQSVDEKGPSYAAGLRVSDLITHINGELVQGLVHTDVLQTLYKANHQVRVLLRCMFIFKLTTHYDHTKASSGAVL